MECPCFVAVLIMWGLVYSCPKQAVQDGMHGVCASHDSASLNKGNILNTEVRVDSVAVECVVPDA
jgi:hypothetical protein